MHANMLANRRKIPPKGIGGGGDALTVCIGTVHNDGERVNAFLVDQDIKPDERRRLEAFELIVERGKSPADRLQPVEEVEHDFG